MRALSASELLDAWERGLSEPPARRSLALLSAACSPALPDGQASGRAEDPAPGQIEDPAHDPAMLSIGQRDAWLLSLREAAFGPQLVAVAGCSECGERLEWTFETADLRIRPDIDPDRGLAIDTDGYHVAFRLPNSLDLAVVANLRDVESARLELLRRCISIAQYAGRQLRSDELPETVVASVVERMSEADPQADLRLNLTCPACGHRWGALFDIEAFFWREISAWAERVIKEVHTLASAYGWRESEVLNLSPSRRQLYLSLVNG